MSDIKFSVIIPCYNVEDKIENCLKSVLNQSMETDSYEVIVVDDGSTDKTKDRIMEYSDYPNVVNKSLERNSGLSAARNAGIRSAAGSTLCFLDSDMTVEPTWLETFQSRLEDESIVGIIGDCKLPNGVKPNKLDHYFYSPIRGARQFGEDECLGFQWFLFNNTAVRRYVIEKVGYFDENYTSYGGEDTELAIRIWESFPNGLRYSSKACSEHHHQRSLDDFCRTMEYYGKNNFPRLINTYPKYKKHLGGDWVQSKKGYLIFNPFTGLFVTILNSLFTSSFLVRFQVIYAVVRGARNST